MIIAAGLLVALAAVVLVLEPVLRGDVATPAVLLPDSDDDVDPVQRRRDRALAALKEIEFDRATGKLSDEDYARLYQKYAAEATLALAAADAAGAALDPVEALIARAKAAGHPARAATGGARRYCHECGAPRGGRGRFCRECGSKVAA